MSETLLVSLAAAVAAVVGAIAGAVVAGIFNQKTLDKSLKHNELMTQMQQKERQQEREDDYEEWYRRTLFEKRLAAAQEACGWLMELRAAIQKANPGEPASGSAKALLEVCEEARKWHNGSTVLLHDAPLDMSVFMGVVVTAELYVDGMAAEQDVWNSFATAQRWAWQRVEHLLEVERERSVDNA